MLRLNTTSKLCIWLHVPYLQLLRTNAKAGVLEAAVYSVRMQLLEFLVRPRADYPILGLERWPEAGCDSIAKMLALVVQADVLVTLRIRADREVLARDFVQTGLTSSTTISGLLMREPWRHPSE
jgi:hypothetical protein